MTLLVSFLLTLCFCSFKSASLLKTSASFTLSLHSFHVFVSYFYTLLYNYLHEKYWVICSEFPNETSLFYLGKKVYFQQTIDHHFTPPEAPESLQICRQVRLFPFPSDSNLNKAWIKANIYFSLYWLSVQINLIDHLKCHWLSFCKLKYWVFTNKSLC